MKYFDKDLHRPSDFSKSVEIFRKAGIYDLNTAYFYFSKKLL
jgi:hypothetical protein